MPRAKSSQLPNDLKLIEGAEKRLGKATLIIAGESYTLADIVALLKERTEIDAAVEIARNALKSRIDASRAKHLETDPIVSALKQIVHGMFAGGFEALEEFGLAPRKPRRALTVAEQLAASTKAKATRVARHTMGKRARLAIKGVVAEGGAVRAAPVAGVPAVGASAALSPPASVPSAVAKSGASPAPDAVGSGGASSGVVAASGAVRAGAAPPGVAGAALGAGPLHEGRGAAEPVQGAAHAEAPPVGLGASPRPG